MTEEQGEIIIELLRELVARGRQVPPVKEPLFRDAWPMIVHKYPIPARIKNAIKWELLETKTFYAEKYQYLTLKEFMTKLRLGEIHVRRLGASSAAQLYQIIGDIDNQPITITASVAKA